MIVNMWFLYSSYKVNRLKLHIENKTIDSLWIELSRFKLGLAINENWNWKSLLIYKNTPLELLA